eukprot:768557-Hanusia_phi.AAC.5
MADEDEDKHIKNRLAAEAGPSEYMGSRDDDDDESSSEDEDFEGKSESSSEGGDSDEDTKKKKSKKVTDASVRIAPQVPQAPKAKESKAKKSKEKDEVPTAQPKKQKKDPNAPKRPKSAWLLFCDAKRDEVVKENPDIKFTEVNGKISEIWKNLSSEEKKPYEEEAAKLASRYKEDKAKYDKENPGSSSKKRKGGEEKEGKAKKAKKDPNAPKRGQNAYMLWTQKARDEMRKVDARAEYLRGSCSQPPGQPRPAHEGGHATARREVEGDGSRGEEEVGGEGQRGGRGIRSVSSARRRSTRRKVPRWKSSRRREKKTQVSRQPQSSNGVDATQMNRRIRTKTLRPPSSPLAWMCKLSTATRDRQSQAVFPCTDTRSTDLSPPRPLIVLNIVDVIGTKLGILCGLSLSLPFTMSHSRPRYPSLSSSSQTQMAARYPAARSQLLPAPAAGASPPRSSSRREHRSRDVSCSPITQLSPSSSILTGGSHPSASRREASR